MTNIYAKIRIVLAHNMLNKIAGNEKNMNCMITGR